LREAAAPVTEGFKPGIDAFDLAGLEGRRAARLAGEARAVPGRDGGDQVRDAEFAGDQAGDEAVGGGDYGDQVAGVEMALDQGTGRRADDRADAGGEEFLAPGVELRARVACQRGELEVEEDVDIQRAGLVLLVELHIFRGVHFAIEYALADEKLRPLEVGVAGEQGVVEVK
jgi:hypothetical protein